MPAIGMARHACTGGLAHHAGTDSARYAGNGYGTLCRQWAWHAMPVQGAWRIMPAMGMARYAGTDSATGVATLLFSGMLTGVCKWHRANK